MSAKHSLLAIGSGAACIAALAFGMAVPASSQSGGDQGQGSSYICMVRVGQASGGVSETRVKVLEQEEQWLLGRGFARSSCGDAENWLRTTGPSMCALADVTDPSFVSDFVNRHGLTPAEICTLSQALPSS